MRVYKSFDDDDFECAYFVDQHDDHSPLPKQNCDVLREKLYLHIQFERRRFFDHRSALGLFRDE